MALVPEAYKLTRKPSNAMTRTVPTVPELMDVRVMQKRVEEYNLARQERTRMYSLLDPLLNQEGRKRLKQNAWYKDIPVISEVLTTVDGYFEIVKNMFDVTDPVNALMSNLRLLGDTLDSVAMLVKAPLTAWAKGTGVGEEYVKAYGLGDQGRYVSSFNEINKHVDAIPDGWLMDLIGEILIDPMNWISFGAPALGKATIMKGGPKAIGEVFEVTLKTYGDDVAGAVGALSKQLGTSDDVIRAVYEFALRKGQEEVPTVLKTKQLGGMVQRLNTAAFRNNQDDFIDIMMNITSSEKSSYFKFESMKTAYTNTKKATQQHAVIRFLYHVDEIENATIRAMRSFMPVGVLRKGVKYIKGKVHFITDEMLTEALKRTKDLNDIDVSKYANMTMEELGAQFDVYKKRADQIVSQLGKAQSPEAIAKLQTEYEEVTQALRETINQKAYLEYFELTEKQIRPNLKSTQEYLKTLRKELDEATSSGNKVAENELRAKILNTEEIAQILENALVSPKDLSSKISILQGYDIPAHRLAEGADFEKYVPSSFAELESLNKQLSAIKELKHTFREGTDDLNAFKSELDRIVPDAFKGKFRDLEGTALENEIQYMIKTLESITQYGNYALFILEFINQSPVHARFVIAQLRQNPRAMAYMRLITEDIYQKYIKEYKDAEKLVYETAVKLGDEMRTQHKITNSVYEKQRKEIEEEVYRIYGDTEVDARHLEGLQKTRDLHIRNAQQATANTVQYASYQGPITQRVKIIKRLYEKLQRQIDEINLKYQQEVDAFNKAVQNKKDIIYQQRVTKLGFTDHNKRLIHHDKLIAFINEHGLDPKSVVAQAYDEARETYTKAYNKVAHYEQVLRDKETTNIINGAVTTKAKAIRQTVLNMSETENELKNLLVDTIRTLDKNGYFSYERMKVIIDLDTRIFELEEKLQNTTEVSIREKIRKELDGLHKLQEENKNPQDPSQKQIVAITSQIMDLLRKLSAVNNSTSTLEFTKTAQLLQTFKTLTDITEENYDVRARARKQIEAFKKANSLRMFVYEQKIKKGKKGAVEAYQRWQDSSGYTKMLQSTPTEKHRRMIRGYLEKNGTDLDTLYRRYALYQKDLAAIHQSDKQYRSKMFKELREKYQDLYALFEYKDQPEGGTPLFKIVESILGFSKDDSLFAVGDRAEYYFKYMQMVLQDNVNAEFAKEAAVTHYLQQFFQRKGFHQAGQNRTVLNKKEKLLRDTYENLVALNTYFNANNETGIIDTLTSANFRKKFSDTIAQILDNRAIQMEIVMDEMREYSTNALKFGHVQEPSAVTKRIVSEVAAILHRNGYKEVNTEELISKYVVALYDSLHNASRKMYLEFNEYALDFAKMLSTGPIPSREAQLAHATRIAKNLNGEQVAAVNRRAIRQTLDNTDLDFSWLSKEEQRNLKTLRRLLADENVSTKELTKRLSRMNPFNDVTLERLRQRGLDVYDAKSLLKQIKDSITNQKFDGPSYENMLIKNIQYHSEFGAWYTLYEQASALNLLGYTLSGKGSDVPNILEEIFDTMVAVSKNQNGEVTAPKAMRAKMLKYLENNGTSKTVLASFQHDSALVNFYISNKLSEMVRELNAGLLKFESPIPFVDKAAPVKMTAVSQALNTNGDIFEHAFNKSYLASFRNDKAINVVRPLYDEQVTKEIDLHNAQYVVFDFETQKKLNDPNDMTEPFQVSFRVYHTKDGRTVAGNVYTYFLKMDNAEELYDFSSNFTHISKETYKTAIKYRVEELKHKMFADGLNITDDTVLVAHNAEGFDKALLQRMGIESNPHVLDTLPLLRAMYAKEAAAAPNIRFKQENLLEQLLAEDPDALAKYMNILAEARSKTGFEMAGLHNAEVDTAITGLLLFDNKGRFQQVLDTIAKTNIRNTNGTDLNNYINNMLSRGLSDDLRKGISFEYKKIISYMGSLKTRFDITDVHSGTRESEYFQFVDNFRNTYNLLTTTILETPENLQEVIRLIARLEDDLENIQDVLKPYRNASGGFNRLARDYDKVKMPMLTKFNDFSEEDINMLNDLEGLFTEIESVFNKGKEQREAFFTAIYGNNLGYPTTNPALNNLVILQAYQNNEALHNIHKMIRGRMTGRTDFDDGFVIAWQEAIKRRLIQSRRISIEELNSKKSFDEVFNLYKESFPEDDITRLANTLDAMEESAQLQETITQYLVDSFDITRPETALAFSQVYEFMRLVDKDFHNMQLNYAIKVADGVDLVKAKEDMVNELFVRYHELTTETNVNKILKPVKLLNTIIGQRSGDIIKVYFDYLKKQVERFDGVDVKNLRLMFNPDAKTANEIYITFKEYVQDIIARSHQRNVGAIIGQTTNETLNEGYKLMESTHFRAFQDLLRDAVSNMRAPLSVIRQESRMGEMLPIHIGRVHEHLHELKDSFATGFIKNDTSAKMHAQSLMNDLTGFWQLSSLGSEKIIRYTEKTKQAKAVTKVVNTLLDGITDPMKELIPYSDSNPAHKGFYNAVMQLIQGGERHIPDANRRTAKRIIDLEIFDNWLQNYTDVPYFRQLRKQLNEFEQALRDPYNGIIQLKADATGMQIDEEAIQELLARVKTVMYRNMRDTQPKAYRDAIKTLLDDGVSYKTIMESTSEDAYKFSRYFRNSYADMRNRFVSDEAFFQFVKEQEKKGTGIAMLVRDPKSQSGWRIQRHTLRNTQELTRLDEIANMSKPGGFMPLGFLDEHDYSDLAKYLKQGFKLNPDSFLGKLKRLYLMPLKSIALLNSAFVLGNIVDINTKNLIMQEGAFFSSNNVIKTIVTAAKWEKMAEDYYRAADKVLIFANYGKKLPHVWVDAYERYLLLTGEMTETIRRDLEIVKFVNKFKRSSAANSEMVDMLERLSAGVIGLNKEAGPVQQFLNKTFYSTFPFKQNFELNGYFELIGRLALHINDIEKGLTVDESLLKILKTHFNYGNKTQAEIYAEFAIPFVSYPLRSFMFWADNLFDKGVNTRILMDIMRTSWGNETLSKNEYAQYQASRGNIPVGNYVIGTNITFADALGITYTSSELPFVPQQAIRKLNPMIKNTIPLFTPGLESGERAIRSIPGANIGRNIYNVLTADEHTLDVLLPGIADRYYKDTFRATRSSFAQRNANFQKPYSYSRGRIRFRGSTQTMNQMRNSWTNIRSNYIR